MVLSSNEKRAFFRQQCREALAAHIRRWLYSLRLMSQINAPQMTDLTLSLLPAKSVGLVVESTLARGQCKWYLLLLLLYTTL